MLFGEERERATSPAGSAADVMHRRAKQLIPSNGRRILQGEHQYGVPPRQSFDECKERGNDVLGAAVIDASRQE
jgi:hypothetical protein